MIDIGGGFQQGLLLGIGRIRTVGSTEHTIKHQCDQRHEYQSDQCRTASPPERKRPFPLIRARPFRRQQKPRRLDLRGLRILWLDQAARRVTLYFSQACAIERDIATLVTRL